MRNIAYGIFILLVAAASGYYVIQSQKSAGTGVTPTPTQTAQPTISPTPQSTDVREVIIQAVKTRQYSLLEPYITEPVMVILYASECCGSKSKKEAIQQLSYLNEAKEPWIFDEDNQTIKKAKIAIPDYFQNAVIGLSGDIMVAFKLNSENKIVQIAIVPKYTLIAPDVP